MNKNKLLIIGCSDAKKIGGFNQNLNIDCFSKQLIDLRISRLKYYFGLFTKDQNYFVNKNTEHSKLVDCKNALTNNLKLPAYERYDGRFYNNELRNLYRDAVQKKSLHILIISGLYGVIRFDDPIIYYHLEIKKGGNWHSNIIHNEIIDYISNNNILDQDVYYSLSDTYLNALQPITSWNNLWINAGDTSSLLKSRNSLINNFFPSLI